MHLDSFDLRILTELQRDNRLTSASLSEVVHLSPAACLRRTERLRRAGVIVADVSIVAPEKVGIAVQSLVRVSLETKRALDMAAFETAIAAAPEVQQAWYVSGGFDYGLLVCARDMASYEAFIRRFLVDEPLVRDFEANITLRRLKTGTAVPVYLPDSEPT
ncbi:transcriptional regulator, AsnC family [Caenispirillum bisanense]|uniref:Transcriptional regulator, AsnC family n=1 Tax=Caenispirillum bisanense TaxID=414052 RepID=A0A286GHP2_9PROT|nr:transcriptional regulator, AsnC family [Caenispirillum bisanense]